MIGLRLRKTEAREPLFGFFEGLEVWKNRKPKTMNTYASQTPNVAKAGGFQSQGTKGEGVALNCNPLAALDLESSGFPARVESGENYCLFRNSLLVDSCNAEEGHV